MAKKGNKKKKEIKDKKLQKVRECEVTLLEYQRDDEFTEIEIHFNQSLEPSQRPRSSRFSGFYDPLAYYKDVLIERVEEILPEDFVPCKGEIEIHIEWLRVPAKSGTTLKQLLYSFLDILVPLTKPDNDNIEKTVYYTLNGKLWKDDSQIYYNSTKKLFSPIEATFVKMRMRNEPLEVTGVATKDEKEQLQRILEQYGGWEKC